MADEIHVNLSTDTLKAPRTKEEMKLQLRCSLEVFWDFAELCWRYCETHIARISAVAPRITKEFIAQQLAYITEIKTLPNHHVRSARSSLTLISVKARRQAVVSEAKLLDAAIKFVYCDMAALIPVERKASGLSALWDASDRDYPAVSAFIVTATNYLKAKGQRFVDAGAVAPNFTENFKAVGAEFDKDKTTNTSKRQTGRNGTVTVAKGVKEIKRQISLMHLVGKNVFEFEPNTRKLFTADYVLDVVRSKHPANLKGRTNWPPAFTAVKPKPIAGLLVEVLKEEGKTATTDKLGRFKIPLAAGEYMVRFSGEGVETKELKVTVEAGANRRLNVQLSPTPITEPMATKLANTVKSLDGATNGTVKSENGVQEGAVA